MKKIKYFSRHELAREQMSALVEALKETPNGFDYVGVQNASMEDEDRITCSLEVEWIDSPFDPNSGVELAPEDKIIAGVFPTPALFSMLAQAQALEQELSVVTFRFERDRTGKDGNATVLGLASTVIYSVDTQGKLSLREVDLDGTVLRDSLSDERWCL
jgi:hypothetical protein